ncbi:MAG TPA: hypothetical protein VEG39_06115 [Clostridia bacterium]|nr:hypothetical protein [Clostridia bacterium]
MACNKVYNGTTAAVISENNLTLIGNVDSSSGSGGGGGTPGTPSQPPADNTKVGSDGNKDRHSSSDRPRQHAVAADRHGSR